VRLFSALLCPTRSRRRRAQQFTATLVPLPDSWEMILDFILIQSLLRNPF